MPEENAADRPSWPLLTWAITQVGFFAYGLLHLVALGLVLAIARRQFRWKAWALGQIVMFVGIGAIVAVVFSRPDPLRGVGESVLWIGSLAVMTFSGALIAVVCRRLGTWECYLAILVIVGLAFGYLGGHLPSLDGGDQAFGRVRALFGDTPAETPETVDVERLFGSGEEYLRYASDRAPGERYFGPMWDRVLGIYAAGAALLTLLGASFGFLLFGEQGRFDPRLGCEWLVARRHLAGRKGWVSVTAVVAVLGVGLGVAALVAVTALMSGYQNDVQDKILSTNAHVVVQKYGIDFVEYDTVAQRALKVPGVLASTPFSFNEAMLSDGDLGMGVLLKGVVPETAGTVTSLEGNLCKQVPSEGAGPGCERYGSAGTSAELAAMLRPENGVPSAVIGVQLFKKLRLPIGGEIALTTPVAIAGARGSAPQRMHFRIGGVFQSGMHEFDSKLIYLHLTAAQELMGLGSAVNGVEFKVQDPENVELVAQEVLDAVGGYPYRTLDWRQLNLGIFTALKLQKIVMFLVLCSIIIVGAFNIASTLFMAVVEKSREIGVLKSIGARDASIMRIFVMEGWVVGLIGTVGGVVFGLLVCLLFEQLDIDIAADVYMVDSLKVAVNPLEVLGTAFAALAVSHLATIYPALRAAEAAPVDAMRYD